MRMIQYMTYPDGAVKTRKSWVRIEQEPDRKLYYSRWYAGHFHIDKTISKLRIVMDDILPYPKA